MITARFEENNTETKLKQGEENGYLSCNCQLCRKPMLVSRRSLALMQQGQVTPPLIVCSSCNRIVKMAKEAVNGRTSIIRFKAIIPVDVIFNPPATIVFWSDNTKTVVKANDEKFDKEKGLAMAMAKKAFGTNKGQSNYYDYFKQFIKDDESEPEHAPLSSDPLFMDMESRLEKVGFHFDYDQLEKIFMSEGYQKFKQHWDSMPAKTKKDLMTLYENI